MNKNKIIMCVLGGVAVVASGVLGYLAFSAFDEKATSTDDFDVSVAAVEKARSAKIAPSQASVEAFDKNRNMLEDWREDALASAARGDFAPDATLTPESFKTRMIEDAKETMEFRNAAGGAFMKETALPGFKDYISGGSMPEKAKLLMLQRQWHDIKLVTRTLQESGAVELLAVNVQPQKETPKAAETTSPRGAKRNAAVENIRKEASVETYEVKFLARPPALVKTLNAFASAERFVTVDAVNFGHAEDTLASVVGGGKEKAEQKRQGRNRRERRQARDEEKKDEELEKKGLVTDPLMDAPMTATLRLSTYDFGTKEAK